MPENPFLHPLTLPPSTMRLSHCIKQLSFCPIIRVKERVVRPPQLQSCHRGKGVRGIASSGQATLLWRQREVDMDEGGVALRYVRSHSGSSISKLRFGATLIFERNVSGLEIVLGTNYGAVGVVSGRGLYHSPCVSPTPTLHPASTPDAQTSKTRSSPGNHPSDSGARWWFLPRLSRLPALALDVYRVKCGREPSRVGIPAARWCQVELRRGGGWGSVGGDCLKLN
jgi:hypothetical protein